MPLTTFKIGKRELVILSRRRYQQLIRAEEDRMDAKIAEKGREAYLNGKVKTNSLEQLKRKIGL